MNGVKLTGLWKSQTKDGKSYFSGTLGGVKVLVFAPREEREKPAREPHGADPELGF